METLHATRDPAAIRRTAEALHKLQTRPWRVMEVCGGQTHAIIKYGLPELLPAGLTLIHGPGCPVCVTPAAHIDMAIELTRRRDVILCSFGDMLRVPGNGGDLLGARASGGDVRIVYSPMDALALAEQNPQREVVFFGVGFETTAPANAMAVLQAARRGVGNFSLLAAHVLVPPAMEAILQHPDCGIDAFLAAGHVCAVMGYTAYHPLAERYGVPIVVTGFEPLDILQGLFLAVGQLERGEARVENQYRRAVTEGGNRPAQDVVTEIFQVVERRWRGLGELPASGLGLRPAYAAHDAQLRFGLAEPAEPAAGVCLAGQVLQGRVQPPECPAFGGDCTPEHPLGAPMVSSEGACAAYYRYRPHERRTAAAGQGAHG
jgi:hydrogenase expression/formation protein HypD